MKSKRKLINLIESEDAERRGVTRGLLTGAGIVSLVRALETTGALGMLPNVYSPAAAIAPTMTELAVKVGYILPQIFQVSGAGVGGYLIGSYIQDTMSGNTGTKEEKMLNSFKRSAKDRIGELGVKIFGFDILPTWDVLSDEEYFKKTIDKGYKGLRPFDIDPERLGFIATALFINRNLTEDGKLPREFDELFAYRYLDAEAFKPFIEKKEKEMIDALSKELAEESMNEGLSRGSLYRRRYYGRY